MNLQTKQKGFTIVELLIVIVVIAILAAISIVAYTGINNRAKASERKSDATSISKVAETINAGENSTGYPTTAAALHATTGDAALPSNIRVAASPVTAAPTTETAAGPAVDAATGVKTYTWRSCGSTTGIVVYYWDPSVTTGNVKTISAGRGC